VPQSSVLGPFLYLLYTADLPITDNTVLATFADITAILSANQNPLRASADPQNHINLLQTWFQKWRIKINNEKSVQITFTTRRTNCPRVTINNSSIPTKTEVKYLGLHLDHKLTWKAHIRKKTTAINAKIKANALTYWKTIAAVTGK
jgi:nicotinamide mononucleotide adenylyltransferase